jgi:hypothetical protein
LYKRELGASCSVDVRMLDTSEDGFVLTVDKNLVNENTLRSITDFVDRYELSLLLENGRYFISASSLAPSIQ